MGLLEKLASATCRVLGEMSQFHDFNISSTFARMTFSTNGPLLSVENAHIPTFDRKAHQSVATLKQKTSHGRHHHTTI